MPVTLTTAVLRRVLQRLGGSLLRLHIDHHWSALNDRTAHTVGKFCPHLEELKVCFFFKYYSIFIVYIFATSSRLLYIAVYCRQRERSFQNEPPESS